MQEVSRDHSIHLLYLQKDVESPFRQGWCKSSLPRLQEAFAGAVSTASGSATASPEEASDHHSIQLPDLQEGSQRPS